MVKHLEREFRLVLVGGLMIELGWGGNLARYWFGFPVAERQGYFGKELLY
ncbi:hypothetical protein [Schlesneria sp. T3-172]